MTNQLHGTVALVTGASSGIGTATAQALPHLFDAAATGARQVSDLVNVSSVAGRARSTPN